MPPPHHNKRPRHIDSPIDGWPLRDNSGRRFVRVKKMTRIVRGEPFLAGHDITMIVMSLLERHENELTAVSIFDDIIGATPQRGTIGHLDVNARKVLRQAFEQRLYVLVAMHPRPNSAPWEAVPEEDRAAYVMRKLIGTFGYSINGAAGLVGNLIVESNVLPDMIEHGSLMDGQSGPDFHGIVRHFSAEEIMSRDERRHIGPYWPGVGLGQFTWSTRRQGLFHRKQNGRDLGASILTNMDAQIEYVVTELRRDHGALNGRLARSDVAVDDACDDVAYEYETPGTMRDPKTHLRLPRADPRVQKELRDRRGSAHFALSAYQRAQAGL